MEILAGEWMASYQNAHEEMDLFIYKSRDINQYLLGSLRSLCTFASTWSLKLHLSMTEENTLYVDLVMRHAEEERN